MSFDVTQTKILAVLADGPKTTVELSASIGASPSMRTSGIHMTLRRMRDVGLIRVVDRLPRRGTPLTVWGLP